MLKTKKKTVFTVLVIFMFLLSCYMSMTVWAASSTSQDGLDATLTTDKDVYKVNENIDIKVSLKNGGSYDLTDVQAKFTLPKGVDVKSGKIKNSVGTLKSGEKDSVSMTAIKSKDTTTTTTTTNKTNTTQNPQTGDTTDLFFWLAMMAGSGSIIALLCVKKKMTGKWLLSLLCIIVIGAVTSPVKTQAAVVNNDFTIEKEVTIDGTKSTIKAVISYDYTEHFKVTVTDGSGDGNYAEGKTVTIKADAAQTGYHFTGWTVESGGAKLTDAAKAETTFVMPRKAVTVKATYAKDSFTITTTSGEGGAITPANPSVTYGDSQTMTITPDTGYHVVDVKVDGASQGAITSHQFSDVKAAHAIEATFAKNTYAVTVTDGSGSNTYTWGDTVTIEANAPQTGYHFTGWTVESGDVTLADAGQMDTTFVMPKNEVTVKATYAKDTYAVTVTDGSGSNTYTWGDTVTIKANTPQTGYHFTGWTVVSGEVTLANAGKTETTFVMPQNAVTVKANYEKDTFLITTIESEGGTITPANPTVTYGESQTFTFILETSSYVDDVIVDGVSQGQMDSYTFTDVKEEHTIEVIFKYFT